MGEEDFIKLLNESAKPLETPEDKRRTEVVSLLVDTTMALTEAIQSRMPSVPKWAQTSTAAVQNSVMYAVETAELRKKKESVKVVLIPGMSGERGQEFKMQFQVSSPTRRFSQDYTLMRAWVPTTGYDVTLDLYDTSLTKCANREQLQLALVEFVKTLNKDGQLSDLAQVAASY
jgi:hypothetical protein